MLLQSHLPKNLKGGDISNFINIRLINDELKNFKNREYLKVIVMTDRYDDMCDCYER